MPFAIGRNFVAPTRLYLHASYWWSMRLHQRDRNEFWRSYMVINAIGRNFCAPTRLLNAHRLVRHNMRRVWIIGRARCTPFMTRWNEYVLFFTMSVRPYCATLVRAWLHVITSLTSAFYFDVRRGRPPSPAQRLRGGSGDVVEGKKCL